MRDEKKTKGRKNKVSRNAENPVVAAPVHDPVLEDGAGPEIGQDDLESYHFEPPSPAADLASLGTLPDDGPEEIPGFLRRCATETSAQGGSFSLKAQNERHKRHERRAMEPAPETPVSEKMERPEDAGRGDLKNRARQKSSKIPTGARLRRETDQVADRPEFESPDWSNSARSALSEMLTDIDNEHARRISNRDKFAALAGMRRSTWPLTALIVSFLLVVLAYSMRNIDASATPGVIWRQAWALVVSPQESARVAPAPLVTEGEPSAALAQIGTSAAPVATTQTAENLPVVEKKATGLVFEPVKIVGPLGPLNPVGAQAAKVTPAGAPQTDLRRSQVARASATNPAPEKPVTKVAKTSAATIALAPSKPVSPDKMPLASLAVSGTEAGPSATEAPRQLRRVASVSPEIIGVGTTSQVDSIPAPAPSIAPNYNVAAVAPQSSLEKAPALRPQPSPATAAALDNEATKAMLVRADRLFEARDVASARLLFERAASYGSAEGAFGAAKTYDPVRFELLGVYGVPAEPEKAAALYQTAIDAGHVQAVEYLNSLNVLRRKMKLQASNAQQ